MASTYYICKYTPIELLRALGGEPANLNEMREGFDAAESLMGPNICGFGKTIIEAAFDGNVRELVLVNCCDTIRSVYDVIADSGKLDFCYMIDVLHTCNPCSRDWMAEQLKDLARSYGAYKGTTLTAENLRAAFQQPEPTEGPYISVMGARMGDELMKHVQASMPLPVRNDTCVNNRNVGSVPAPETDDLDELLKWYAGELLSQLPCMRMIDTQGRKQLYNDPNLQGIIYHTVKFCDFYSFEYAEVKSFASVPLVKIESDYTTQSTGQLLTRIEAFAETIGLSNETEQKKCSIEDACNEGDEPMGERYYAGIDSGSTSTDVAILNEHRELIGSIIIPTGAGASISAETALDQALEKAGLSRDDIACVVATGYGRAAIQSGDKNITEISCHARGAHFLDPRVRTVIDIGGQDSKVIALDDAGQVKSFAMNDKCAAGTGRFLEMMAHTLQLSLDEMAVRGLHHKENITISSTCSVFAESEVISLIAENKDIDDIINGLNKSVTVKTVGLAKRVGATGPYMMTGGVAKNKGVVSSLEQKLGQTIIVHDLAQLCGAIGAALYATEL